MKNIKRKILIIFLIVIIAIVIFSWYTYEHSSVIYVNNKRIVLHNSKYKYNINVSNSIKHIKVKPSNINNNQVAVNSSEFDGLHTTANKLKIGKNLVEIKNKKIVIKKHLKAIYIRSYLLNVIRSKFKTIIPFNLKIDTQKIQLKLYGNEIYLLSYNKIKKAANLYYDKNLKWQKIGNTIKNIADPVLTLNKKGVPIVVFSNLKKSGKIEIEKLNGPRWAQLGKLIGNGYCSYISIDSKGGFIYVAFADGLDNFKVKVYQYYNKKWNIMGSSLPANSSYTALAISENGNPYVIFTNGQIGYSSVIYEYTNGIWFQIGGSLGQNTTNNNISITKNNEIFIGYNSENQVYIYNYKNFMWNFLQSNFYNKKLLNFSLAIGKRNIAYVLLKSKQNTNVDKTNLYLYKYSNNRWDKIYNTRNNANIFSPTLIDINSNNMIIGFIEKINKLSRIKILKISD